MKYILHCTAQAAQHVLANITERFLGNQSVGTTVNGCDDQRGAVASFAGFQSRLVPMTVIAASFLIHF
jgi:hypothetical protein